MTQKTHTSLQRTTRWHKNASSSHESEVWAVARWPDGVC